MLEFLESGPAKSSRIIVGLQALTLACLVSWLALFHGSRVVPKRAKSHARTTTKALGTERDDDTAGELVWIGNENSTADEPLSFDEDPFSVLHFRVHLPAGQSSEPSSGSPIQPVELVFHSSWSPAPDAISLHISGDGVSAFQGSYLSQYPSDGRNDSRNFAVRDGGTIRVYPPSITGDKATRWSRETWYGRLIIITVMVSIVTLLSESPTYLLLETTTASTGFLGRKRLRVSHLSFGTRHGSARAVGRGDGALDARRSP